MTDARFPERWLNNRLVMRLSDRAFRVFVTSLVFSVSNRTDGLIDATDVDLLPVVPDQAVRDELVCSGLWELRDGDGYGITVFEDTQTTAAQLAGLDRKRRIDADRQARHRSRRRDTARDTGEDVTDHVTDHVTRDTEDRPGQARTGQDDQQRNSLRAVPSAVGDHRASQLWDSAYDD